MTDLSLPITSLAAIANGLILLSLTWRVIALRRRDGVVLGDNDDRILTKAIRGQANAAEQMPMALLLLGLVEVQNGSFAAMASIAVILTVGRLMHAIYFAVHGTTWRFRFYGMLLTLFAQGGLVLTLVVTLLS